MGNQSNGNLGFRGIRTLWPGLAFRLLRRHAFLSHRKPKSIRLSPPVRVVTTVPEVTDESRLSCPVCGAENPADAVECGACGFALRESRSTDRVDDLLEDLLELSKEPAAADVTIDDQVLGESAAEEEVDEAQVEQLFDSLLLEIQPSTPPPRPARREIVHEDLGGVERIPVLATPEETEARKLPSLSGRLLDLVTLGSAGTLILVFVAFRMWTNPFDLANPLPLAVFAGVALCGMVAGIVLFHISNSAVSQGDRFVKAGRYQESLAQYDRAIRMVRRPSYAWTSRGVALKYLGRLDDALRCHENALRLDPENEVAWTNLGTVYFKKGELGKALDCYDKAIKLHPKYAIAWNNKGVVLARLGRFEDADRCHEKATKIRPEYVAAWLNRGEVLTRLGAREEAQRCLERARSISRGASA